MHDYWSNACSGLRPIKTFVSWKIKLQFVRCFFRNQANFRPRGEFTRDDLKKMLLPALRKDRFEGVWHKNCDTGLPVLRHGTSPPLRASLSPIFSTSWTCLLSGRPLIKFNYLLALQEFVWGGHTIILSATTTIGLGSTALGEDQGPSQIRTLVQIMSSYSLDIVAQINEDEVVEVKMESLRGAQASEPKYAASQTTALEHLLLLNNSSN